MNVSIPENQQEAIFNITNSDIMNLSPVEPNPSSVPNLDGFYFCFFKPADQNSGIKAVSLMHHEGGSFVDWHPYASWHRKNKKPGDRTTKPVLENIKKAFLPLSLGSRGNRFTGLCVFDQNNNKKFDKNEAIYEVPEFALNSNVSNLFSVRF